MTLLTNSPTGSPYSVVVGLHPVSEDMWREEAANFTTLGSRISVRRLNWERVAFDNAKRMFFAYPRPINSQNVETAMLPRDFGNNFMDCDLWFNIADLRAGAMYGVRPTAHFLLDTLPRQLPEAFPCLLEDEYWTRQAEAFRSFRSASVVVVEAQGEAAEVASYAGLHPDDVMAIGEIFGPLPAIQGFSPKPLEKRLLWHVEPDASHCFEKAAAGLERYLADGGSLLPVLFSETPEAGFRTGSNIPSVASAAPSIRKMLNSLPYQRLTSEVDAARALALSEFAWDSGVVRNVKAFSQDALMAGLPLLSAQAVYWDPPHAKNLIVYAPTNVQAVADELRRLEQIAPGAPTPPSRALEAATAIRLSFVIDRLWELTDA